MSMLKINNNVYHVMQETQPSWMRCERYDYCEPMARDHYTLIKKKSLTNTLKSLLFSLI